MITDAWHAWILHKRWVGDTSAHIEFFTLEKGIVRCLQKGARAPKNQSRLQLFTPLWLSVSQRQDFCFVREIEITGKTLDLSGRNLFSAFYANELLHHFLQPFDVQPALFESYVSTINSLQTAQGQFELEAVLRRFEYHLLSACGYAVELTEDAKQNPINALEYYNYIAGDGFYPAANGILGRHILGFAGNRLDDPDVLRVAKKIMRSAIDYFLEGKRLKARELFSAQL